MTSLANEDYYLYNIIMSGRDGRNVLELVDVTRNPWIKRRAVPIFSLKKAQSKTLGIFTNLPGN